MGGACWPCSWGFGLSLICFWFISVPPVRGGTYFSLPPQRKVGKRKRLEAPAKWAPWSATGSGATGIRALAHSAVVTKESSAPTPHCVRRGRVCLGNHEVRFWFVGAVGFASARCSRINRGNPTQQYISVCHDYSHGCAGGNAMTSHGPVARRRVKT